MTIKHTTSGLRLCALTILYALTFTQPVAADTFTVSSTSINGTGSLRAQIEAANNNPGHDIVSIPASLGEIVPGLGDPALTSTTGAYISASFFITDDITIRGEGPNRKIINDHYYWIDTNGGSGGYPCVSSTVLTANSDIFIQVNSATSPINITLENILITHTGGLIDGDNVHLTLDNMEFRESTPTLRNGCSNNMISIGGDSSLTINDSYLFRNKGPQRVGSTFIVFGDVTITNSRFWGNDPKGVELSYMFDIIGTSGNPVTVDIRDSFFQGLNNAPFYFIYADVSVVNTVFDGPLAGRRSGLTGRNTDISLTNVTMYYTGRLRDPRIIHYDIPATHVSLINGDLSLVNTALISFTKGDFPIVDMQGGSIIQSDNSFISGPGKDAQMLPSIVCSSSPLECFTPVIGGGMVDTGSTALALYPDGTDIVEDMLGANRRKDSAIDIGAIELDETFAKEDSYQTKEGEALIVNAANGVMANDKVGSGDVAEVRILRSANSGWISLHADGSFEYTPKPGFLGLDTFEYRLGNDAANKATVNVNIQYKNQIPTAAEDHYPVRLGKTEVISAPGVLVNDVDLDNVSLGAKPYDSLFAVQFSPVSYGTLNFGQDGSFTYTANFTPAAYNAPDPTPKQDSFYYNAFDYQLNESAYTQVTLQQVVPAKFKGVRANDDHYTMHQGQTLSVPSISVLDNDNLGTATSSDLIVRLYQVSGGPSNASVTLLSDGTFTYTPAPGFSGDDTFTYTLFDGIRHYVPFATVTVTVTPVQTPGNNPPVGLPETLYVDVGDSLTVSDPGVLTNDLDPDNQPPSLPNDGLEAVLITDVSNGTLVLDATGGFQYTPSASSAVTDTFVYRAEDGNGNQSANITVTLEVQVPVPHQVVMNADHYSVSIGTTLTVDASGGVISNDRLVGISGLTALVDKPPLHGSLTLNSDGSFTYVPTTSYSGDDLFSYILTDGSVRYTPAAAVSITVVDPSTLVPPNSNQPLIYSHADHYCSQSAVLSVDAAHGILRNDVNSANTSGDLFTGLSAALVSDVSSGVLSFSTDGSFVYTANSGFSGKDQFTYSITSTQGASGPADSTVSVIIDSAGCGNSGHLFAVDDSAAVRKNNWYSSQGNSVLDNDNPSSGAQVHLSRDVTHGVLQLNADGTYTYTPEKDFTGRDTFAYYSEYQGGHSNVAVVSIFIQDVNLPPVAVNDAYTVYEGSSNNIAAPGVLSNDFDPEGVELVSSFTAVLETAPAHGSLTLNANGSFSYLPDQDYTGQDSFTYYDLDPHNGHGNATEVILSVYKALDSDGDGIANHNEAGDNNNNGISDAQEA